MSQTKPVLGIESSCDETAAAVVSASNQVLSSVIHSQIDEHADWGGVVPEVAGRSHLRMIRPVVEQALKEADLKPSDLGGIAVTHRPGLLGSLLIGTTSAKALAFSWDLPLVGVHHIEAHSYAALMPLEKMEFPYITLVVSGGHTSLYKTTDALSMELLGSTRDDAAGEALDKAAKMLGLGYPGGPAIQKAGAQGDPLAFPFKMPLIAPQSLDFSFSGMKTALLYTIKGAGGTTSDPWIVSKDCLPDLCASFESIVARTLARKCRRACEQTGINRVLVGGGVACNTRLREVMAKEAAKAGFSAQFAPPAYCTDNAVMIAGLGGEKLRRGLVSGLDLDVASTG
ncbi:MAG: tRNA (adenosine(37)-N6)-threonylcarbamoyltransferase complex transferase subunit TsaD [Planctomycetota bacterium]|nr:tRNA (adenosine(37)-N6)-threonylcarbamoyltransferase complex transferase subunit TsaD [Planctomycetota bacterium]MDA1113535.1 tRNA (adenosine(37)-N6)-threonylcarbamoyltransferase complex transferase subunit TsaD [Planctomycetota bacterium]